MGEGREGAEQQSQELWPGLSLLHPQQWDLVQMHRLCFTGWFFQRELGEDGGGVRLHTNSLFVYTGRGADFTAKGILGRNCLSTSGRGRAQLLLPSL